VLFGFVCSFDIVDDELRPFMALGLLTESGGVGVERVELPRLFELVLEAALPAA
jgi:hypothetical protein